MILRREAEEQANSCFQYHAGAYALTVAALALIDPRCSRWVAGIWGAGVALHAGALYAIPQTRESLLRATAIVMEDRRQSSLPEASATPSTHPAMA